MTNSSGQEIQTRKIVATVLTVVGVLIGLFVLTRSFTHVAADEIVVVQHPISGKLEWYTMPGLKLQYLGHVVTYHKRMQFWFSSKPDQGSAQNEAVKIRFNDGAEAHISGSMSWEMPLDSAHLTLIHTKYGSERAVEQQLIRTNLEKSLYMTGPLMSSAESYATRRNDLLSLIYDQQVNGVYRTASKDVLTDDLLTGQKKTIKFVEPLKGPDGNFVREEESPLKEFGVKVFNLSINEVKYGDTVEQQIQAQQKAIMDVQTAIAQSKTAEQNAITVAKQGEANAAKAKWEQEVIKATEVTKAQQQKAVAETDAEREYNVQQRNAQRDLSVATLKAQAAEQYKRQQTLEGEGDATRRKLVMEADGALAIKLNAYIEVNKAYAVAIQNHQGPWVPSIFMAGSNTGSGSNAGSGAVDLINLLTAKAAKDLSLDMSVPKQPTSSGEK
ncbi:MAG: hypothetical protein ABSF56_00685 [Minisyncoccia bacterium]|jgi:regulator of protease activity HflC (stomatin/prohibitin superfamily)